MAASSPSVGEILALPVTCRRSEIYYTPGLHRRVDGPDHLSSRWTYRVFIQVGSGRVLAEGRGNPCSSGNLPLPKKSSSRSCLFLAQSPAKLMHIRLVSQLASKVDLVDICVRLLCGACRPAARRRNPQKALRGGIPRSFLEPLGRSWGHFVGIYRQKITRSLKN